MREKSRYSEKNRENDMSEQPKKKHPGGRPRKEFNKKLFIDLVGLGCTQEEICFVFRNDDGLPIDVNTLSSWCKRNFGMSFSEYAKQNRGLSLRTQLRRNQIELSKRSAAMAIFLGKNYLGQTDVYIAENRKEGQLAQLIDGLKQPEDNVIETVEPEAIEVNDDIHPETT